MGGDVAAGAGMGVFVAPVPEALDQPQDAARAGAYATRLERAQATDPFSQFLLAQQEAAKGAFERAIVHYRKAIRLLPAEPAFHRALAVAYLRKGDAMAWQRTLERAQALEDAREKRRGIRLAGAGPG